MSIDAELKAHYLAVHERLWMLPPSEPEPMPSVELPDIEPETAPTAVEEIAARWREINDRLFGGRATPKSVIHVTAAYYGLSVDEIKVRTKLARIVKPRQVALYIMRTFCRQVRYQGHEMALVPFSFIRIAGYFGLDHATVIHSVKRVKDRMQKDEKCAAAVADIVALLGR